MHPYSCIPIIMVSAKSKEEHIVEGLAAGSNDYVVKPFGRQEILARITSHVRFRDSVYNAGALVVGVGIYRAYRRTCASVTYFAMLVRACAAAAAPVAAACCLRGKRLLCCCNS